ncbi:methyl-accepting chemotaxis protein [Undibacterium rugosum]|uniref:methyl-accepting chemotaxis protein n=1 Tax=Undibacterium rugosum TaxID=2762291 RepID=UPI001B845536|nr:methyl-accepting chemotaxis protein [Undibacterium rugosum]MBR7780288.1 MCP four helix bundle domain-containing protein [Undibacterium rugosum]
MSIAKRLYLLMILSALTMVGVSMLGLYQTRQVFNAANYANINTVPSLDDIDKISVSFGSIRSKMWQYFITDDAQLRSEFKEFINKTDIVVKDALVHYEKENISDDKDRDLMKAVEQKYAAFSEVRIKAIALADENKPLEARDYVLQHQSVVDQLVKALNEHAAYNRQVGLEYSAAATKTEQQATWASLVAALFGLAVMLFIGIRLTHRIVDSMRYAVEVAGNVAKGDLTAKIEVTSDDEVGQVLGALRDMNANLLSIVSQVRSSTDNISSASGEIATGNMDLSSRTEAQASSLEETASSMEELTSTVKQNADNARHANQLAVKASQRAAEGGDVVNAVVTTMNEINTSAHKIEDIISVIDGIAFQTNILALNAAVEAARAGEQGRGFAVVAAEVRTLAHRSAAAAKEIKVLIDDSVSKVQSGTLLVSQAGTTIEEVVTSVRQVADVVSEITAASQEQTHGIDQINVAVSQMDETTQQNAALVEQAAAAAASLQEQAEQLAEAVKVFKLVERFDDSQISKVEAFSRRHQMSKSDVTNKQAVLIGKKSNTKNIALVPASGKSKSESTNDDWEEF